MSARPHQHDAYFLDTMEHERVYVHAGLDDAPLILDFDLQLERQRELDETLRKIAEHVDFELRCLLRGIDPRAIGRG